MIKDKEKRNAYFRQYQKDNEARFCIVFRKERDADIVEYLKSVPNKTELMSKLIRQHMKNGNQE